MKKLLAVLMMLALCASACAEGASFAIRNGVSWGMSPEEVLEAEGNPSHELGEQDDDGFQTLKIEGVTQGGAACDIEYEFLYEGLYLITFEYDTEETDVTYDRIEAALKKSFGEPGDISDDIKAVLSLDDASELEGVSSWKLEGDTHVWLMEDADEHTIEIMLVDLSK